MKKQDRDFLLRLVNGNTSIFDRDFLDEDNGKAEEEELKRFLQEIEELLPESMKEKASELESAINAVENEACIQAYLDGMVTGARIVHILLREEDGRE